MATKETGEFVNGRGQKLASVAFVPAAPVAKLLYHHGMGEHTSRFDRVFSALAGKGIAVFSFDAHAHGNSEPKVDSERALIWKFDHLVDDLYTYVGVVEKARPELASLPFFVGGGSLGGLVAAHAVLREQSKWAGLVLQSPALDVEWTLALKIQAPLSGLLSRLIPRVRMVPAVRPEDMSPNAEDIKAFLADPLIFKPMLPVRTGAEVLNAFRKLTPRYAEFTLPVYAAHGTADKCTSYPATKSFVARITSTDKTLREVPGGYHELLQSTGWEEHVTPLADWVLTHAATTTTATAAAPPPPPEPAADAAAPPA